MQFFSKTYVNFDFKLLHTRDCPIFVLDRYVQGGCIPKWDTKADVGICLGHLPCHVGSVALVLNPTTVHVSPQFHVVFDEEFSTVHHLRQMERFHFIGTISLPNIYNIQLTIPSILSILGLVTLLIVNTYLQQNPNIALTRL